MLGDDIILSPRGVQHHFASHRGIMQMNEGMRLGVDDSSNHSLGHGGRDIKAIDPHIVSFFDLCGIADERACKLVDAGVVHDRL